MTCKICHTNEVTHYGGICHQCLPAYQQGVTDATNAAYKSINSELLQIIRMNKSKIL